jgi:acyl-CoA thioesterase-1
VLLAGMRAAPNLGADYLTAFDAIFPDLAAKYGVPLYPFFLDGVAGQPGLQLEDGLHPNARGVDLMVERILPTVEKAIAAVPGGR